MHGEANTVAIFGGTGDLTQRKLLPALFQLACKGRLPENLKIVGFAQQDMSDDQFRRLMGDGVREFADLAVRTDEWEAFAKNLSYVQGEMERPEAFIRLSQLLATLEAGEIGGTGANQEY